MPERIGVTAQLERQFLITLNSGLEMQSVLVEQLHKENET